MARVLTASDRSRLIRLAAGMDSGDGMRRAILAGLCRVGAAKDREVDPAEVFGALAEISADPDKYGVGEGSRGKLAELVEAFGPVFGDRKGSGKGSGKTAADVGDALGLAVAGVGLVTAALSAVRKLAGRSDVGRKVLDSFLENTAGAAYAAAALGAAAFLSQVAPEHPIAAHASRYDGMVQEAARDLPVIKKMTKKVEHVVQSMGDRDMDKSLSMISDTLVKTKLMSPPPVIPPKVVKKSLGMHHALQDLHDVIHGRPIGTSKSKSNVEEGATYAAYLEKKKSEGGKPMGKEEWEARYGDRTASSLPVLELRGRHREFVGEREVRGAGIHKSLPGSSRATTPVSGRDEAERVARDEVRAYERSTWPGGMASVDGLVHWVDTGLWSGLVSSYYSPS